MFSADNKPLMVRNIDRGQIVMRGEQTRETQDNKPAAAGKAGTPGKPRPMTKNDTDLMRAEMTQLLDSLDAGDADEQTKRAIIAQAEKEWQGGAAGHATAVKAAIDKLAPEGFQRSGIPMFRKSSPVGGAARASGAITPAQAAQAAPATTGEVPAPQQRVKDRVYQTPRGPMKWTGTGWVMAAPGTDS
jgi:hypothetical protein